MSGRPVVSLTRDNEQVSVETEPPGHSPPDMRVVPVGASVGEGHLVRESLSDRNRRLRLVRTIEAVLDANPVPMDSRVHVAAVCNALLRDRRP